MSGNLVLANDECSISEFMRMQISNPDDGIIQDFYKSAYGSGLREITLVPATEDGEDWRMMKRVWVDDWSELTEIVKAHRDTHAIFICVGTLDERKRNQKNTRGVRFFIIDLDPSDEMINDHGYEYAYFDLLYNFEKRLVEKKLLPKPSAYIVSGNGIHAYYIFSDEFPKAEWSRHARVLETLCIANGVQADPAVTKDCGGLLRVPGSKNFKAGIAHPRAVSHSSLEADLYDIDRLLPFLERYKATSKPVKREKLRAIEGKCDVSDTPQERDKLDSAMQYLLATNEDANEFTAMTDEGEKVETYGNRELWVKLLHSLKSLGWHDIDTIARGWSERGSDYDEESFDTTWGSINLDGARDEGARPISIRTFYNFAEQRGWTPPVEGSLFVTQAKVETDIDSTEVPVYLTYRKNGKMLLSANETNVASLLRDPKVLRDTISYDLFHNKFVVLKPIGSAPAKKQEFPHFFTDSDEVELVSAIRANHKVSGVQRRHVIDGLLLHRKFSNFDPLRDKIEALAGQWDGQARLDTALQNYFGANEDPRYLKMIFSKFLISAIARALSPGIKVDHMLIVEATQGLGKDLAFQALVSAIDADYYGDNLPNDVGSKDALMYLHAGNHIVHASELTQMRWSNREQYKSFLTRQVDSFRGPYEKAYVDYPRRCVFVGSTNEQFFLQDDSGSRRFWPTKAEKIDVDRLAADAFQLWSEAYDRYIDGEAWWPEVEQERELAQDAAEDRRMTHPWVPAIFAELQEKGRTAIATEGVQTKDFIGEHRRLQISPGNQNIGHSTRIGEILCREFRFVKKKSNGKLIFWPTQRSFEILDM